MPQYVAFLRGINVGSHARIQMDALRQAFESLGYSCVATYIASGNVMFEARGTGRKKLVRAIEKCLRERFGFPITVFLRTRAELEGILNRRPFGAAKPRPGADQNIIFVAEPTAAEIARELTGLRTPYDEFRVPKLPNTREVYWRRQKVRGTYKAVNFEKLLRQPCTVRTTRTISQILALLARS